MTWPCRSTPGCTERGFAGSVTAGASVPVPDVERVRVIVGRVGEPGRYAAFGSWRLMSCSRRQFSSQKSRYSVLPFTVRGTLMRSCFPGLRQVRFGVAWILPQLSHLV